MILKVSWNSSLLILEPGRVCLRSVRSWAISTPQKMCQKKISPSNQFRFATKVRERQRTLGNLRRGKCTAAWPSQNHLPRGKQSLFALEKHHADASINGEQVYSFLASTLLSSATGFSSVNESSAFKLSPSMHWTLSLMILYIGFATAMAIGRQDGVTGNDTLSKRQCWPYKQTKFVDNNSAPSLNLSPLRFLIFLGI